MERNGARIDGADLRDRLAGTLEERDRARWAQQLFDGPLQGLVAFKLLLGSALEGRSEADLEEVAALAVEGLDGEIDELRRVIGDLHPAALDQLGLGAAIDGLLRRCRADGLETIADVDLGDNERSLPIEVKSIVYRIVKQALENVRAHADAGEVVVQVQALPDEVRISVRDDGAGFEPQAGETGGLRTIRERVNVAGGSFDVVSSPATGGSEVRATLPARQVSINPRSSA